MKANYLKSVQLVIVSFFLFCCSIFSCQSNSKSENQEVRSTEAKKEMRATFSISDIEDDINGTQSTITATINNKKIEITKTTNCSVIEKMDYESKEIPDNATWACTCWWAGAGKDFYAKKENTKVLFYEKEVYEDMKTEDKKWELLKAIE